MAGARCSTSPISPTATSPPAGSTAERVVAHLESFRPNTVDAPSVYFAISRAKAHASIYTDSRADLTTALGIRTGQQIGALDEAMRWEKEPPIAMPQPAMMAGMAICD